jgi:hypothetical protein
MCETHLGRQEPRGCRHIYGDPATEDWRFCQRKIAPGGRLGDPSHPPYCAWHTKAALQPTTEAAKRNFLKFVERMASGADYWVVSAHHSLDHDAVLAVAKHLSGESDNLVPVDVHVKIANRKGILHG